MLKAQNFFLLDGLSLGHKFKSYQSKKFVRRLKFVITSSEKETNFAVSIRSLKGM